MATYIYTSIALNYLPKARVLSTTLKKFHPDWRMWIVLAEKITPEIRTRILEYPDIDEVISVEDIHITDGFMRQLTQDELNQWFFEHSIVEFCTAIKGSALCHLLHQSDCEQVFYFDPDIAIFDNLNLLVDYFTMGYSVLLTPHATDIETTRENVCRNEISNLRHGIYNLGFIGVKNDPTGQKFAKWWKSRLDMYCYDDIANGVFTDQSWCDMVPAVFENVKILREPQYNVSTWNLTHRVIDGDSVNELYINNRYRLSFYHFSGFDSGAQIAMLLRYARRMPKLFLLRKWYKNECNKLSSDYFRLMKWTFGYYEDGAVIDVAHRKLYRTNKKLHKLYPNPFAKANGCFFYEYIKVWQQQNFESLLTKKSLRAIIKPKLLKLLHKLF